MACLSVPAGRIILFLPSFCSFFNVTIPAYSSLQVMREMLTSVVHMEAWGIDGDDVELSN